MQGTASVKAQRQKVAGVVTAQQQDQRIFGASEKLQEVRSEGWGWGAGSSFVLPVTVMT